MNDFSFVSPTKSPSSNQKNYTTTTSGGGIGYSVPNTPQAKFTSMLSSTDQETKSAKKSGNGNLPVQLRAGLESQSGVDMSDVKVHYNSTKPVQLQAAAYAQGNDIHLGPGQEQHLAHEAWHVVQQKQGRVNPTMQADGAKINDSKALEQEADQMGAKAENGSGKVAPFQLSKGNSSGQSVIQRMTLTMGSTKGKKRDEFIKETQLTVEDRAKKDKEETHHIRDKWGDIHRTSGIGKAFGRQFGTKEFGRRRSYKPGWFGDKFLARIKTNEELKIVGHGSGPKVSGYTGDKMAALFVSLGLPTNYAGRISIYGCLAAEKEPGQDSFIQALLHGLQARSYNSTNVYGVANVMMAGGGYEMNLDDYMDHEARKKRLATKAAEIKRHVPGARKEQLIKEYKAEKIAAENNMYEKRYDTNWISAADQDIWDGRDQM